MPEEALGGHWGKDGRQAPTSEQTTFSFDALERLKGDQLQLRALFGAMVRKFGGPEPLALALDKPLSYYRKIQDAYNGMEDRKVQLDWFAPLFECTEAMDLFMAWVSDRCGYEPAVRSREVDEGQEDHAAREVLAELAKDDPELREVFRRRMAKKLGIRPERLRF